MAIIRITLEGGQGRPVGKVEGRTFLLDKLLPTFDDSQSQCLRFIDAYGDTVFNRLQMDQFLREWEGVAGKATTDEEKALADQVRQLAEMCRSEPHLYLKFYGD